MVDDDGDIVEGEENDVDIALDLSISLGQFLLSGTFLLGLHKAFMKSSSLPSDENWLPRNGKKLGQLGQKFLPKP